MSFWSLLTSFSLAIRSIACSRVSPPMSLILLRPSKELSSDEFSFNSLISLFGSFIFRLTSRLVYCGDYYILERKAGSIKCVGGLTVPRRCMSYNLSDDFRSLTFGDVSSFFVPAKVDLLLNSKDS